MKVRPGHVAPAVVLLLVVAVVRVAVAPAAERPAGQTQATTAVLPIDAMPAGQIAEVTEPVAPEPVAAEPVVDPGERPIEPAPETFEGSPAAGTTSCGGSEALTAGAGSSAPGDTWAVIVGINDYPGGAHDLFSSVNDATDVDRALAHLGVADDHRLLLLDGEASSCGVQAGLDWLVERAAPDSTAVFFFAGHARMLGPDSRTLVGADGALLTDVQLGDSLSRLRAGRAWIALATCYGGGFTQVLGANRVLTGASDGNSLAYENQDLGRSYLVEFMVRRALLGDAASSSVEAAFAYARTALQAAAPKHVPVQFDQFPGELDLRPASAAPQTAPTGEPPGSPPPPPRANVTPTTRPCRPALLIMCSYG